jgi:hypothetical protein
MMNVKESMPQLFKLIGGNHRAIVEIELAGTASVQDVEGNQTNVFFNIDGQFQAVVNYSTAAALSYAKRVSQFWLQNEAVDWEEAETLVELVKTSEQHVLSSLKETNEFLKYFEENDEWDCDAVSTFAQSFMKEAEYKL